MKLEPPYLRNPQLDGSPFFWPGGEIAILCLHGFSATTVEVRKIAGFFSQQGYTVAAPLLPGHGTSPADLNGTRWEQWYAVAEEALQKLMATHEVIFILGESMGALLCLQLAAKYPGLKGLMICAPAIKIKNLWLSKFLWPLIDYLPKGKPNESIPQQSYKVFPVKAASSLFTLQKRVRRNLPNINIPIIIFQGKRDETVDPSGAVTVLEEIGSEDKQLIILQESAHIILLDKQLAQVEELCQEFVLRNA